MHGGSTWAGPFISNSNQVISLSAWSGSVTVPGEPKMPRQVKTSLLAAV